MEYCEVGGKLIHEKNQKQKISWHCPFEPLTIWDQLVMTTVSDVWLSWTQTIAFHAEN